MVERRPLRLVPPGAGEPSSSLRAAFEAALRLMKSERGALFTRTGADAPINVETHGLSPEEEVGFRELARKAWHQTARAGYLTSSMGGSPVLARVLDVLGLDAAFVVLVRSSGGKIDAQLLSTLQDVALLLEVAFRNAQDALLAQRQLEDERRHRERLLALNHAFQSMADAEDVGPACSQLLDELAPHFPGIELFSVWLLEADGQRLRRVALLSKGLPATDEALTIAPGDDLDQVIRSGNATPVRFSRTPRARSSRSARKAGIAMTMYVPLRSRNAVTGMLMLSSVAERVYSADDRAFLDTLSAQLGGQLDAIRERERTEAEWERLRILLETLPVGIALLDAAGRVVLWNRAVEEIWGHGPVVATVERFAEAYGMHGPEGRPLEESPVARVLGGGPAELGQEFLIRRRRGGDVPVIVNTAPIQDPQGRLAGVVTVYQDITQLREVDRLKDNFISSVSHELRTPTTTVRGGALTLLKRGDQLEPEVRRQLLEDMAEEAERLYHLVEDLLVLSRLQAGMQLHAEPLIAHRFVNKVISELVAHLGILEYSIDVPPELPLVDADPACLEQVLRNLLENAAKFSPRGGRVEIMAEERGRFVLFSVLDRGSGIPAADMDRVFEPFYKTADAVRTGSQGAGLGLAVCKRLVEVQGGRIWAESRPGGGTAFRFSLPVIADEAEE